MEDFVGNGFRVQGWPGWPRQIQGSYRMGVTFSLAYYTEILSPTPSVESSRRGGRRKNTLGTAIQHHTPGVVEPPKPAGLYLVRECRLAASSGGG